MKYKGSCHYDQVVFEVEAEIPAMLTRCTCLFCTKRGMLHAYYTPEQFHLTIKTGDAIYRWQSKLVAHHFCTICGCGTFSNSPAFEPDGSWDKITRHISVNARLFDNLDAATAPVVIVDGKNLW